LPATKQDADPFVGQGADDDPVTFFACLLHLVEGAGPEAVADRFVGVFDKALVKEERSGEAAVDNGGSPAAFEHGSDATEVEHRFCAFKAFAPGTERGQESGTIGGAAAGQSGKERGVRVLGKDASDLAIEAVDGSVRGAQSQDERLHSNDGAFDQRRVVSQRDASRQVRHRLIFM